MTPRAKEHDDMQTRVAIEEIEALASTSARRRGLRGLIEPSGKTPSQACQPKLHVTSRES
jgi:hypothetical protein